ncbi:MAG: RNA-binding domain-containing protein [Candidatus Heimdallarchaeaceae archaeon]
MEVIITKITCSLLIHSTESMKKNIEALKKIASEIDDEKIIESCEQIEGGYGNPIEFLQLAFTKKNDIESILKKLKSNITDDNKKLLFQEFDNRFDKQKTTYFLRLNKEKLLNNQFIPTVSSNSIKLSFKMRAFSKKTDFREFLAQQGVLLPN